MLYRRMPCNAIACLYEKDIRFSFIPGNSRIYAQKLIDIDFFAVVEYNGGEVIPVGNYYHFDNVYFEERLQLDGIELAQIGRMYCEPTMTVGEHVHAHPDLYELTVVTAGSGTICTDGVPTSVTAGDVYLSFPGDTHGIVSSADQPLKFDFLAFHCYREPFAEAFSRLLQQYHAPTARVFRDEWIPRLVSRAAGELHSERLYSRELLGSLLQQTVICVLRAFQEAEPTVPRATVTPAEVLCYQMMNYVDTHVYTMHDLQELAEALGYSYGYLSALFKKTTGDTLSHYYTEKKAQIARLLLQEGRLRITEIAEMLGYANVYAFSKAFRKRFGVSPRTYRQQEMG